MKWTPTPYDKTQVANLVNILKRAKFDVTGLEIVAFTDVFKWVNLLHDRIEEEITSAGKAPALLPSSVSKPEDNKLSDVKESPRRGKKKTT